MRLFEVLASTAVLLRSSDAFRSITIGEIFNTTAGIDISVTIGNDDNDLWTVNYTVGLYTTTSNELTCTVHMPALFLT
jgi:hypothetical protein